MSLTDFFASIEFLLIPLSIITVVTTIMQIFFGKYFSKDGPDFILGTLKLIVFCGWLAIAAALMQQGLKVR